MGQVEKEGVTPQKPYRCGGESVCLTRDHKSPFWSVRQRLTGASPHETVRIGAQQSARNRRTRMGTEMGKPAAQRPAGHQR